MEIFSTFTKYGSLQLAPKFRKTRILVIEFLSLQLDTIHKTIVRIMTISSPGIDAKNGRIIVFNWNGICP